MACLYHDIGYVYENDYNCMNIRMVQKEGLKALKEICNINSTIICERDSHKGIIIGKQGNMLKKIGSAARYEIERLIDTHTNLKLFVTVKKNWRDSDMLLKNYGYVENKE